MKSKVIRTRSNRSSKYGVMSFISAVIMTIIGFIILQPFFWVVIVYGNNFHHYTFPILLMLVGFVVGAPMFIFGIINLFFVRTGNGGYSNSNLDIGRIRYVVETDRTNRK